MIVYGGPFCRAHLFPHLCRKRLVITQPSLVSSVPGLRATGGRQASLSPNPASRRVSEGLKTTEQVLPAGQDFKACRDFGARICAKQPSIASTRIRVLSLQETSASQAQLIFPPVLSGSQSCRLTNLSFNPLCTIDLCSTSATIKLTGRAGSSLFSRCPESMSQYCFQILTPLLILWQLLLPCSAPWLHTCIQGWCAHTNCEEPSGSSALNAQASATPSKHSCACAHHAKSSPQSNRDSKEQPPAKSHDCSNCAVCQAIAAPRTLVAIVSLEASVEVMEALVFADGSDPLLGFELPARCRAPPAADLC